MKRINKLILTGTTLTLLLGSVAPSYAGDNVLGTLLGAAGGAVVGSNIGKGKGNIAAIAAGTLLGAGIGNSLTSGSYEGNTISTSYYREGYSRGYGGHRHHGYRHHGHGYRPYYSDYSYSTYTTYPSSYTITQVDTTYPTATPAYYSAPVTNTGYCREFQQTVSIGGRIQESYGTACMQPDGTWEMQK